MQGNIYRFIHIYVIYFGEKYESFLTIDIIYNIIDFRKCLWKFRRIAMIRFTNNNMFKTWIFIQDVYKKSEKKV